MKLPRIGALIKILAIVTLAFAAGVAFVANRFFPYYTLQWYWSRLSRAVLPDTGASGRLISTTVLDLQLTAAVSVPVVRRHWGGGGFTSVGNELVLLTYDGRIFIVTDQGPQLTRVVPPNNGFAAYVRVAGGDKTPNINHYPESLRYLQINNYTADEKSYLVVSYSEWRDPEACYGNAVARLPLGRSVAETTAAPEDWTVVYRSQPCLPLQEGSTFGLEGFVAGGALAHSTGHTYFLTNGDFEWNGVHRDRALAQGLDNDYGKVLELNLESGAKRIVARGVRNAQGIVIRNPGEIYTVEHGQRGGDELNRIIDGADYGYPSATLTVLYSGDPWPLSPDVGRHSGFTPPLYAWLPSVGPSNLTEIRGFDPRWDGDLLVATLVNQTLFRLRLQDGRVQFAEPIRIGSRIRSVHQHTDGRIALWTDDDTVVFISRADANPYTSKVTEAVNAMPPDTQVRVRKAFDSCLRCHFITPFGTAFTPGLGDVFGRRIAAGHGTNYSEALRSQSGSWSADRLKDFLRDPAQSVPGTTMPATVLGQDEIDGVVAILKALATFK